MKPLDNELSLLEITKLLLNSPEVPSQDLSFLPYLLKKSPLCKLKRANQIEEFSSNRKSTEISTTIEPEHKSETTISNI